MRPVVLHQDAADLAPGPNGPALALQITGHGPRDGAHPPLDDADDAPFRFHVARQERRRQGAADGVGVAMVSGMDHRGPDMLRLEKLLYEIGVAGDQDFFEDLQVARLPGPPHQIGVGGRRREHIGMHDGMEPFPEPVPAPVALRVPPGEGADGLRIALRVLVQHQVPAVGVGTKREGFELKDLETVAVQLQVFRNPGVQCVEHEGTTGEVETGEEFLRDTGPTDYRAPLQDLDLQTRPRQITARDQSVVPRPDDEDVDFPRFSVGRFHPYFFVPVSCYLRGGPLASGAPPNRVRVEVRRPHSEVV